MAVENSRLIDGNTLLLEVSEGKSYAITTIIVCNTYTPDPSDPLLGQAEFDLHLITKAEVDAELVWEDAISNRNKVINGISLNAGETYSFDSEKLILTEGDIIVFAATPDENPGTPTGYTNLSATVSYLEV